MIGRATTILERIAITKLSTGGHKPSLMQSRNAQDHARKHRWTGLLAPVRSTVLHPRVRCVIIRDFGARGTQTCFVPIIDISARVAAPDTILGAEQLVHKQILKYYIVLTRPKPFKSPHSQILHAEWTNSVHHIASMHVAPRA